MRSLIPILIALLLVLQYQLWVGEGSRAELYALRHEIAAQQQDIERLKVRNAQLHAEVLDLKQGLDAVEERARHELGMIKPGETFLQIIERRKPEEPKP